MLYHIQKMGEEKTFEPSKKFLLLSLAFGRLKKLRRSKCP
jgi:hypothetical protein